MQNKDDGLKADFQFCETLSGIVDLVLKGTFLIPVCTSTILLAKFRIHSNTHLGNVYTYQSFFLQFPYYHQGNKIVPVFNKDEITSILVNISKTDKTPDDLVGKLSYEQGDLILRDWQFFEYTEQRSAVIEEGELTTMSEIHAGTCLNGDIQFKNYNLELEITRHQTDTNSENHTTSNWDVEFQNSTTNVQQFKHCIINTPSSPYSDAFLSLDQQDAKFSNEIHKYKLMKKLITQEEYIQECEKFSSRNDFFILFTTAENCNINLPKQSGIVDGKVFNEYFGPFAGRAYRFAMFKSNSISETNINIASLEQLCRVYRIGKKQTSTIISTRPF
ncbi:4279_t:CDS:2 [Diversispora eburnea]|uniref:4279_t:CDS:1 n=1 Tax=Diversispora eburnea TaxID=1213867 RepID=A0A9N9G1E9_9GLOM|nr:4279_t:CDS:2 [Diversispora eburnea]